MQIKSFSKRHNLIHESLTYLINGICFEAHNQLGRYSREKQYCDYIEKRFKEEGIKYNREYSIGDSGNIVDFLIDDKLILEIKAKSFITKADYYQTQRYLQITGLKLALLVNFRNRYLRPKRIIRVKSKKN